MLGVITLTGCSVDDDEYFGNGSISENPVNLQLHSNSVGYLVNNYDIKSVNKDYKRIDVPTFNTSLFSTGGAMASSSDSVAANYGSVESVGSEDDNPGNESFTGIKDEWITDDLKKASSERQKLVKYALKYVGNKYVFGGNSLTNGIDCSGFTQQIYGHFGYSLPRTSSEQRKSGTEISAKDMKPGDLICYYGHVAIYIGNGKIVHASNRKPYPVGGIKVSNNYKYRSIASIRRIIK